MDNTERQKTCPQCGTVFGCTPVGCWCSKLPPVMPMTEGAECYCPKCLGAIIETLVTDNATTKIATDKTTTS